MEKASKELLKEFVNSQKFTSTTDIMNSMKELFSDVIQQVMEAELEEKLGYEKSQRVSESDESGTPKNYRNGYSKKTVKTQLGEVDVKIPRDRNGEYEPQIIGKYNRNADGMEEKILALYACGMSQRDISEQIKNLYDVVSVLLPGVQSDRSPLLFAEQTMYNRVFHHGLDGQQGNLEVHVRDVVDHA